MFQTRVWQRWLDTPPAGSQVYYGVSVRQFGLETVRTRMKLRDLAMRTGGEPARLMRGRRTKDSGQVVSTLEDQSAELTEMLQRSFKSGKRTNVERIGNPDYGYIARVLRNIDAPGFFPEFLVAHPDPAFKQDYPVELHGQKVPVGLVVLYLSGPMVLLDGQTRLQGAIQYARSTGRDWVLDEDAAVCIIPGVPVDKAKQIFVTVNSTPVPVSFDDLISRDALHPGYALTRFVIENGNFVRNGESIIGGGRGKIRRRAIYQFVMQTLLGSRGEAKNSDYLLEEKPLDEHKERLICVIKAAQEILGPRWGDTSHLLFGGYGLATIGRIYHDTTLVENPPIPFEEAVRRMKRMSWNLDDERWLKIGITAPSRRRGSERSYVTKLTSFDMIRRVLDIVVGDDWKKFTPESAEWQQERLRRAGVVHGER